MTKSEKESMRLFRGQAIADTNEGYFCHNKGMWVCGKIVPYTDCRYLVTDETTKPRVCGYYLNNVYCEEIDPETLSEWTGYKDCNGEMVFEGDIISVADLICYLTIGDIEDFKRSFQVFEIVKSGKFEIVGNIYDNQLQL